MCARYVKYKLKFCISNNTYYADERNLVWNNCLNKMVAVLESIVADAQNCCRKTNDCQRIAALECALCDLSGAIRYVYVSAKIAGGATVTRRLR